MKFFVVSLKNTPGLRWDYYVQAMCDLHHQEQITNWTKETNIGRAELLYSRDGSAEVFVIFLKERDLPVFTLRWL
jgi:hypothetical protein